ncbi:MAG: hypothetical protein P4L50_03160 [Anaerolineaceae bacterium]|nr:hypothetical protein [Anaerolineaceae bacterium]
MTDLVISTPKTEAESLGLSSDHIRTVKLELSILRRQGLLIDLVVSGTGMFTRQASWSELGIPDDDIRSSRLTRGQKFLIPEEQIKRLRSVETRMRQWLDKLSYDVIGFRPYRWLPFTAYETWRDKWAELLAEFNLVKADIIANHDQHVDSLAADFSEVAAAAWRSIQSQGYDYATIEGRSYDNLDDFSDIVKAKALAKLPTVDQIESGIHADYVPARVYGDEDIAIDQLQAQKILQQAELEHARMEAKKQEAYLQSNILQEQFDHVRRMDQLEQSEKELKIEAMLHAEAEHAREQLSEITSPFAEVFTALRTRMAQSAKEILESVQKNNYVRGKVAEKGRGLVEIFDLLAVQDDSELRGRLVQLRSAIGEVGEDRTEDAPERSTAEIAGILEEITSLVHTATKDLTAGPSRFSLVE